MTEEDKRLDACDSKSHRLPSPSLCRMMKTRAGMPTYGTRGPPRCTEGQAGSTHDTPTNLSGTPGCRSTQVKNRCTTPSHPRGMNRWNRGLRHSRDLFGPERGGSQSQSDSDHGSVHLIRSPDPPSPEIAKALESQDYDLSHSCVILPTPSGMAIWWLVVGMALASREGNEVEGASEHCKLRPVVHVLEYKGCLKKLIPSFMCQGSCTSYVQVRCSPVSGSKLWQTERSCMCCQESGEREATVTLFCPKSRPLEPRMRQVLTRAPKDCICRACTAVEETAVQAQEVVNFVSDPGLQGFTA
ncbi:unnamed protein product [Darwinula stevensoni]|uniref:Bursicon n=1 Tax=Darwinula stevensoni TaxID=69355 RepID=A0A7R8X5W0_9CRUS|nr:unnamed protein product [Darwinula stevensoni]CAG0880809.1 unnamed protein product [Darwinula stevensoni]